MPRLSPGQTPVAEGLLSPDTADSIKKGARPWDGRRNVQGQSCWRTSRYYAAGFCSTFFTFAPLPRFFFFL